jgi:hypothetical protein
MPYSCFDPAYLPMRDYYSRTGYIMYINSRQFPSSQSQRLLDWIIPSVIILFAPSQFSQRIGRGVYTIGS